MFEINMERYNAGRSAYRAGHVLADVFAVMRAEHEAADKQDADWRAMQTSANSFALGFVDGVIDDMRTIVRGTRPGGTRA